MCVFSENKKIKKNNKKKMENFENRKTEFKKQIKKIIPQDQTILKLGYGSGFIWQEGNQSLKQAPMMDLLIIVKNLKNFHFINKKKNPNHYKNRFLKRFFPKFSKKSAFFAKSRFSTFLFYAFTNRKWYFV